MARNIRVGITHGDINGIGYEVMLKALAEEGMTELCTPVIFGCADVAKQWIKMLGIEGFRFSPVDTAAGAEPGRINLVDVGQGSSAFKPGEVVAEAGALSVAALEAAAAALEAGEIDVLVTAPICKENVQSESFSFPGHTEFLEKRLGGGKRALMLLFNDMLRIALVTTHLPLKDVPAAVTAEAVERTVRALDNTLRRDFAIDRPRIAVLSLNPHCGDGGLLGSEEKEVITPVVEKCRQEGLLASGPYAADGFFGSGRFAGFDGVVAMYHDQGLAPFKTIAAEEGVNFTAGLPYVRTSPDHGTAFAIAGRNEADPTSMRHAIFEAVDIFRRRAVYDAASANPLRRNFVERGADKTIDFSKVDSEG